MDPFTRYNSYLSQIMQAQEIANRLNTPQTGILASSVINTVPKDEGIMTLTGDPQNQTNNPTATNTNVNYRDVLSFIMNPGFFFFFFFFGALSPTGRTLTDRIADLFTNRKATTFGDGISDSVANNPGMNFGSRIDDPSFDEGDADSGNGVGSGANEGGSGADSGSGTHSDPGD